MEINNISSVSIDTFATNIHSLFDTSTDNSLLYVVETTKNLIREKLQEFAQSLDFMSQMEIAFGSVENIANLSEVYSLKSAWLSGNLSSFPAIEMCQAVDINGANGAFASATNKIYLSQEFLVSHLGDTEAIADVLLEEYGHFLDAQINQVDSAGDEGAIFAALVLGRSLDDSTLQTLRAEDDHAIITVNSDAITIEKSDPISPLINGLGGAAGFGENSLDRNDDGSTGFINITSVFESGLNFFGTTYNGFYINNNGNVTFTSPQSTYIPYALTGNTTQPIIAPFFTDVDTRAGFLTPSLGGNSTGSNLVYWDLDSVNDRVIVTWDDVGQYSNGTVPNAFQLVLKDTGSGSFNMEFRYEDIQWLTGSASSNTLAKAGYSAGNGINFYELPQSGTAAMIDIESSASSITAFSVVGGTPYQKPTDISLSVSTVNENSPQNTLIGLLTTADPDANDAHTYSLVNSVGGRFAIVGNQLQVANGSLLNFEANSSHAITIATTDKGGLTFTKNFVINLNDVNEVPTDAFLSSSTIKENQAIGTVVGDFITIDPDAGGTFTYELVAGEGATDNDQFMIANNQLTTNAVFDYATKKDYSVRIRSTDQGGLSVEKNLAINVKSIAPGTLTFVAPQFKVNENGTSVALITVTRSGGDYGAVSATINLKDGTAKSSSDYKNEPIIVNFTDGEISKTVSIPIVNDNIPEPNETFNLTLTNPTGGATIGQQNSATVTIIDRNAPLVTGFPNGAMGSNKGSATIVIAGQNFSPTDRLSIIANDGTERMASKVYWVSSTEVWATFDLVGLSTGQYDVNIQGTQNSVAVNDAFTVTDGAVGSIQTKLSYPAKGFATFTYTNVGQTDLVTPLFRVVATNAQVNLGQPNNSSSSVLNQLLGLDFGASSKGASGVLAPGASGQLSFAYTPNGNGLISFAVEQVPASEVIDWATIKTQLRSSYSSVDSTAYDVIWQNLTASLGQTIGDFQAAISKDANYLSSLGASPNNLSDLFNFEWQKAANTLTGNSLVSSTDLVDNAPGFPLSFTRTFSQSTAERYNLGELGRGWSSQWDLKAVTNQNGNVEIHSVGTIARVFTLQTDGSFLDNGGAKLTINNGQYLLKEINGSIEQFAADGTLSYVQDTNNNRITLEYSGSLLTRLAHSNGDSLNLSYNAQGRISQITDSAGEVSTYSYDPSGEYLLSVTTPQGTTSYTYDTGNVAATKYNLLSITNGVGSQANFQYDNQGRLSQQSSNNGTGAISYSYDPTGGVTVTDATGATTKLFFNQSGQIAQTQDALGRVTQFQYDGNGKLTNVVAGDTTSAFTYDSLGNLLSTTDPLGLNVNFTYSAQFNRLQSVKDQRGNITGYGYDSLGNLNAVTYADGSKDTYSYDAQGNLSVSSNRKGQNIQYTYDSQGLLTRKDYADGTSATYTYDNRENLLTATDVSGTVSYTYDSANRVTSVTEPSGTLQFAYDVAGRRTQMVDQTGAITNYIYDAVGRLSQLTDGSGKSIITYTYDTASRLSREDNGNGTYTTYGYDAAGQVLSIVHYAANGSINSRYDYTYNNLGFRTSMTTLDGTTQYGYDADGQLTSTILPNGRTIQYSYDAAGNRRTVADSGVTTVYSTNNLNEYTNVGGAINTYDADGNLISKTENGQTTTYSYNIENRLIGVTTPTDTWTYKYDALGNRISSIHNGQQTDYLIDPMGLGNVVGEYSAGNQTASYTYGLGLVSRSDATNGTNFYDTDAIGSTVGLTASDGSYVNRYSYLPFGEDLTKIEGVSNPFEYVGQWGVMDEGNGLDFMRARFYNPLLGKFNSSDPLGIDAGDSNFYRYTLNNPISYSDPSGNLAWFIPLLISGGISAGIDLGIQLWQNDGDFSKVNGWQVAGSFALGAGLGALGPSGVLFGRAGKVASELGYEAGLFNTKSLLNPLAKQIRVGWSWNGTRNWWSIHGDFIKKFVPSGHIDLIPGPKSPFVIPWTIGSGVAGGVILSGGRTHSDPHLQTIDGLKYDLQTVGEFTLVKSTTDDFEIQTRQQPYGNSTSVSTNTAVAIKADGQRIAFYIGQTNPLVINGTAVDLPDGLLYAVGQNLISRVGNQYSLITANNDLVLIKNLGNHIDISLGLADNRKGNVVGLLGNDNGNTNDDFALRDGTVIGGSITNTQLYGDFANSWRITQPTSLFDYATGQDTNTFTDLTFPNNIITSATLTPAQRAAALQIAQNAGITDHTLLEDAILDIAATNGAPEFIQGYTTLQREVTVNAPNSLLNPDGFGSQHWLAANAVIPYTIRFSNNAAQGTTPVSQVTITQQLDTDLDLNTFALNSFSLHYS